ncbi:hypothetical protein GGR52DRAFT_5660 [Hypoxylon sp. FL1284]|nr:hypothetical protein GGR52DRAFT_5660 [Hypoxylon sp. FL1284]
MKSSLISPIRFPSRPQFCLDIPQLQVRNPSPPMDPPPTQCDTPGDPDTYGIGVRLGLYAQAAATLLTAVSAPSEAEAAQGRVLNLLLQLATSAGALLNTDTGRIRALDAVVVAWLLLVGAFSSLPGSGARGSLTGTARLLFYAALSAYGCWFWFGGADGMWDTPCLEAQIVFFGGATLDGWFRVFGKVVAILGLVVTVAMLVRTAVVYAKTGGGQRIRRRPQTDIFLTFLSLAMIVLSVTSAEYVIKANHLGDVNEIFKVGQMLALLAGLFQLLNTIFLIFIEDRFRTPRCWLLFGRHLS